MAEITKKLNDFNTILIMSSIFMFFSLNDNSRVGAISKKVSYSLLQKTILALLGPYEPKEKVFDPPTFARLLTRTVSKVWASQYWRSKIRGLNFVLKLKFYFLLRKSTPGNTKMKVWFSVIGCRLPFLK